MIRLFVFLTILASMTPAHAAYSELDPRTSEEILLETYVFDENTRPVEEDSLPLAVREVMTDTYMSFELGDGPFVPIKSAVYAVNDSAEELVGYIMVEVLASADPDRYYLAWVYISHQGQRLNDQIAYEVISIEDLDLLPAELQLN